MADLLNGYALDDPQEAALNRRRKLAEALLGKGIDTSPVQSPWQGLARVAQAIAGKYMSDQADQQDMDRASKRGDILAQALSTYGGTPAWNNPDNPSQQLIAARAGNPQQAYAMLLGSNDPALMNAGLGLQVNDLNRQAENATWNQHFGMQNEAETNRLQMQIAAQERMNAEKIAAERQMAADRTKSMGNFYAIPTSQGYYGMDKRTGMIYPLGFGADGELAPVGGPVGRGNLPGGTPPAPGAAPTPPGAQGGPAPMPGNAPGQPSGPAMPPAPQGPMPTLAPSPAAVPTPNMPPANNGGLPPPQIPPRPQGFTPLMPPSMDANATAAVAGAKSSAEAQGKAQGEAVAALPQVQQARDLMLGTINSIESDPQLSHALGMIDSRLPDITSYNTSVRGKIAQLQGQAFLQAYNTLRGGGQITEVEGAKATAAMLRLNAAQSEEEFRNALSDLKGVIERSGKTSQQKAGMGITLPGQGAAPIPTVPSGGGWSIQRVE